MRPTAEQRDQAIREHVEWCTSERDACAAQLKSMENGTLKVGHIGDEGMIDETPEWMAKHRHTIEQMDRIITAYRNV